MAPELNDNHSNSLIIDVIYNSIMYVPRYVLNK